MEKVFFAGSVMGLLMAAGVDLATSLKKLLLGVVVVVVAFPTEDHPELVDVGLAHEELEEDEYDGLDHEELDGLDQLDPDEKDLEPEL